MSDLRPHADLLPTAEQIAAAKAQCLAERQVLRDAGIWIAPDEVEIGLRLANVITAAVYGARGEKRN